MCRCSYIVGVNVHKGCILLLGWSLYHMKLSLCLLLYSFVSICMKYLFLSLYFQSVSFHPMCLFIYFFEGSICYGSCFLHKSAILSFNWSIFKSSSEDLPIDFREGKMQGGRERERERERNTDVREKYWLLACHTCPDRGPNMQTFSLWDNAPTTWDSPARALFGAFNWFTFKVIIDRYVVIAIASFIFWSYFSLLVKEVPLTFLVISLFWWWNLFTFSCLGSSLYPFQF